MKSKIVHNISNNFTSISGHGFRSKESIVFLNQPEIFCLEIAHARGEKCEGNFPEVYEQRKGVYIKLKNNRPITYITGLFLEEINIFFK